MTLMFAVEAKSQKSNTQEELFWNFIVKITVISNGVNGSMD